MRFRWSWHCLWFLLLSWYWRPLANLDCLQVIDAPVLAPTIHSHWHPNAMECVIVMLLAMNNAMMDLSCETDGNPPLESLQIWFVQRKHLDLLWIWGWLSEEDRNWFATYLGLGVLGLDSRDLILPLLPFTRFRDASLDLAPPTALFGERSLQIDIKSCSLKMFSSWACVQFEL